MSRAPVPKRVFLSSTASDLTKHRERVKDAIERLESSTIRMETFGARSQVPVTECVKLAASADALVVIVAHRYGWVPALDQGGDQTRSITWLEVDAARAAGVSIFAFVVDES